MYSTEFPKSSGINNDGDIDLVEQNRGHLTMAPGDEMATMPKIEARRCCATAFRSSVLVIVE